MKLLSIFGTRPEAIKMAPVVKAIADHPRLNGQVCVTGQHREMLQQVLELFSIEPDYSLDVMSHNQNLTDMFSRLIAAIGETLRAARPDAILVHGDTATTLAASLAAYFEKIPVAHIEAGLRTHNLYSPWPEEANRKLTGGLARWHFAPTPRARQNLLDEAVEAEHIYITGNTVIDALLDIRKKLAADSALHAYYEDKFGYLKQDKKLILVTGHRRESFGRGFENICAALREISLRDDVELLYPVHLNPNVQKPVNALLQGRHNIHLIEPVDYQSMVYLINRSHLILTDSGGIQEEAPALGKPVLVMRDTTERPEAIEAGTAKLVGTAVSSIVSSVAELLDNEQRYKTMAQAKNPFGDGSAARQIAEHLAASRP